jgi:hypothetical protein
MGNAAEQLLDLVRRLEPHLTAQTLLLDLRVDRPNTSTGHGGSSDQSTMSVPPVRRFHRAGHVTEGSSSTGPISLAAAMELQPCPSCFSEQDSLEGLLLAIDDRNLNHAAVILHELRGIEATLDQDDLDHGGVSAVGSIEHGGVLPADIDGRLRKLDEIALRFLTDSVVVQGIRTQLLTNPVLPQHRFGGEMAEGLVARMHRQLVDRLGSKLNLELLRTHVGHEFGIDGDESIALVQLRAVDSFPMFGDSGNLDDIDAHSAQLPLTLRVLFGPGSLLEETLLEMPAWAARTMKLLQPSSLRSSIHQGLDPKIAETATALWSRDPEDLYHHLDHCVAAARSLVAEAPNR